MNMGHGLTSDDPTVTAAFRTALDHQFLVVLLLILVVAIAWNTVRTFRFRRASEAGHVELAPASSWPYPEPAARRLLRISFGILWVVDGLLQTQSSMPLGLTSGVITPSAASSPTWVQHVVSTGVTIWNDHPVTAAAASVWIQVGIGLFLLVAPRGRWSRTAGLVSVGWGLVVWAFGEAFGGIFGQGSSWLFGTPGAVLLYAVAGGLVALPDRFWETPRLGRVLLRCTGIFFVGMAVLQAWPGRGFWSGSSATGGTQGTLAAMAAQMSQLSQPSVTASAARSFASFDGDHAWAVNFIVVVLLAGIGVCFLAARARLVRIGVMVGAVLCLATWVLVQDFGFLGGLGTDPNSMIPLALVFTSGYLALVRLPVRAAASAVVDLAVMEGAVVGSASAVDDGAPRSPDPGASGAPGKPGPPEPVPSGGGRLTRLHPSYLLRSMAALAAVGIVVVGAAPMALAATSGTADPILNQAVNGSPNYVDSPAPSFSLTDQTGATVSMASLAGHTVALTFLDPTCTSDCPLIAQELRLVDQMLGPDAAHVELVAVGTNPLYTTSAATAAFDRQEGMAQVPNWHFVTGPLAQLQAVWNAYGVETDVAPAGAMVAHSDLVYLIDGSGHLRVVLTSDPGAIDDSALHSSFAAVVTAQIRQLTPR
jgi:cytochrome oxidase Cu insertion factor (SCO1/SenC/PrrC family)